MYTALLVHEPAVPNTEIVATLCTAVTGGVITNGDVNKFGAPEKPPGNVQVKLAAPVAVKVMVFGEPLKFCEHNVFVPTIDTVGKVTTDKLATAVLVHPCGPVTMTV